MFMNQRRIITVNLKNRKSLGTAKKPHHTNRKKKEIETTVHLIIREDRVATMKNIYSLNNRKISREIYKNNARRIPDARGLRSTYRKKTKILINKNRKNKNTNIKNMIKKKRDLPPLLEGFHPPQNKANLNNMPIWILR